MMDADARRCSAWAQGVDLSPIGTCGSYRGYLLIERPLPWQKDIGEAPALSGLAGRLSSLGIRLQALVPTSPGDDPVGGRLILHAPTTKADGFAGYRRFDTTAVDSAGDSLEASLDRLLACAEDGQNLDAPQTDLLVCTHGSRDGCCGTLGTDLALRLAALPALPGIRHWRTSHTGGHRFAPTFLLLPQGTSWGFADVRLARRVVHRSVPFAEVAGHYRGCPGLPGPHIQVLERAVLSMVGWELLDECRGGGLTGELTRDGGKVARLQAGSRSWEGVVRPSRTIPIPDCRKTSAEATKTTTEWTVSDVRAVA
jgi:hypothetical protein